MRLSPRFFLALAAVSSPPSVGGQSSPPSAAAFHVSYDGLRHLSPNRARSAAVSNLRLQREGAEFHLLSGTLQFLTPQDGGAAGAVFVGSGTVTIRIPLEMERREVVRVLKDSLVAVPIASLVFVFADSTASEFGRQLQFAPGPALPGAEKAVRDAIDFLTEDATGWAEPALMTAILDGVATGFFAARIQRVNGEPLLFRVDPFDREPVGLLRHGKLPGQHVQLVAQYPGIGPAADSVTGMGAAPEPVTLRSYRIESTIQENLAFSAVAEIHFDVPRPATRWTRFSLHPDLRVDSILTAAGTPLPFVRPRYSRELWIGFGSARTVRVFYHGALLRWDYGWVSIRSTGEWFPRSGFLQLTDMELLYHTPSSYRFVSSGKRVESRVEGKVETSRWVTEGPASEASFNIGSFAESELTDPRIPPVTVQVNEAAHRGSQFNRMRDPQAEVGADVANSLAFFTRVFGRPLSTHFSATEIPGGHGQAFPGLIHLSWATFQLPAEDGANEVFRAHEMAHQWWGIGAVPATYRDAWLAEGFADFSGMWYMQLVLEDNDKYFKFLASSAQEIRRAHDDAPPIAMGYRIAETAPEHYPTLVYRKGAWVVHMLRNLMLDFKTMSEDRFAAMMRDFYGRYRGRRASTEDFQRVVEEHVGLSMDWFFDEWVRGTDIPSYTLSWTADARPDGTSLLHFRVRQEHVPASFIMPVPLEIVFADSTRTMIRVNVRGERVEGELPVPARPVRLQLNPLQSVLAEVREVRWEKNWRP